MRRLRLLILLCFITLMSIFVLWNAVSVSPLHNGTPPHKVLEPSTSRKLISQRRSSSDAKDSGTVTKKLISQRRSSSDAKDSGTVTKKLFSQRRLSSEVKDSGTVTKKITSQRRSSSDVKDSRTVTEKLISQRRSSSDAKDSGTVTEKLISQRRSSSDVKDSGSFRPLCTEAQCLWLHTAYKDPRASRLVRVIVVGDLSWLSIPIFCHFHFRNGKHIFSNRSIIVPHMGRTWVNIDGFTVKCNYPRGGIPDAVSLSVSQNTTDGPILPLIRIPMQQQQPGKVSACLAPLHGMTHETVHRFIEWIEYYQLLGVSYFVAYNWSVTDLLVIRVLDHYIRKGILELVSWRPLVPTDPFGPWPPRREVLHYFGQMSADTDCMYRLMNRFQWLLYCDLDEFLVPKVSRDLPSLVSKLYRTGDILLFRTADFDRSLGLSPIGKGGLLSLNYTRHLEINGPHYRSKIIVDPSVKGESMGVHKIFLLCPNSINSVCFNSNDGYVNIPPKEAVMHHYRFVRDPKERKYYLKGKKILKDETMVRFGGHLLMRVKQVYHQLKLD